MSGYLASNPNRNVAIPGGIRLLFKRTGDTYHQTLGDISDVTLTPTAEYLEFSSAYDGISSVVKRILQSRALTINATLNEINNPNLRHAFLAGAPATASINIIAQSSFVISDSNTCTIPDLLSISNSNILEVRSEDGGTLYTASSDWTSSGQTLTIVTSSTLDTDTSPGDRINVLYRVIKDGSDNTQKMQILSDTSVEGSLQFQIRQQDGGLAQIVELDSVLLSPNGDITYPVDNVQSLPLQIDAQQVNGQFGNIYTFNQAALS